MAKKKEVMLGYKGFDKDWKCRGMQYKVGKSHTHKGEIKLCSEGLHFCENPLDVLNYYDLVDGNIAIVEASDVSDETRPEDSKRVAKKLTVKAKLDLSAFVKASVEFVWNLCKQDEDSNATVSDGDSAQLAASGDSAQLAASGYYAKLAASGDSAQLAASGNDSIAAGIGYNNIAKATKGSWIVLAEWVNGKPKDVQAVQVDGKTIKADTYYKLQGGKFVEVKQW
ncbi:MAG TPA: hypothetical protein VIS56_02085 [Candidatus Saccharimonadales bacterium]